MRLMAMRFAVTTIRVRAARVEVSQRRGGDPVSPPCQQA